jgi:hypothetical protein
VASTSNRLLVRRHQLGSAHEEGVVGGVSSFERWLPRSVAACRPPDNGRELDRPARQRPPLQPGRDARLTTRYDLRSERGSKVIYSNGSGATQLGCTGQWAQLIANACQVGVPVELQSISIE